MNPVGVGCRNLLLLTILFLYTNLVGLEHINLPSNFFLQRKEVPPELEVVVNNSSRY